MLLSHDDLVLSCCELSYIANFLNSYFLISRISPAGLSTKNNMAINSNKDYSESNLRGSSSIPVGGTFPSRNTHGNGLGWDQRPVTFTKQRAVVKARMISVCVCSKNVTWMSFYLWWPNRRFKYTSKWICTILFQKRGWLCRSKSATWTYRGLSSIKWVIFVVSMHSCQPRLSAV